MRRRWDGSKVAATLVMGAVLAVALCTVLVALGGPIAFGILYGLGALDDPMFEGVVVDPVTGRPIEGVEVINRVAGDATRTDASGAFTVKWMDYVATSLQPLIVFKSGVGVCAYERDWLHLDEDATNVERIEFLPSARLVVRVEDAGQSVIQPDSVAVDLGNEYGAAIAQRGGFVVQPGARISPYARSNVSLDGGLAAQFDVSAYYEIRCITVTRYGHAFNRGPFAALVPGETRELTLRASGATCVVRGTVTFREGQQARGHVAWRCGDAFAMTRIGADGSYALREVDRGVVELVLFTDGPSVRRTATIDTTGSEESVVDFAVTFDPSRIRGHFVHGVGGEPIAHTRVEASPRAENDRRLVLTTTTDADGAFTFDLPARAGDEWSICESGVTVNRIQAHAGDERALLYRW